MKKIFTTVFTICLSVGLFAQTAGTLTFTFTQVAHSPCYQSNYNVLAAWIETSSGTFVKTKLRYCCGGNTLDHLPTWSVNAGGTSSNSSAANKTDATTGSTLHGFGTKTFTWDGKNVNGTSNGTLVADGTYKVAIQETWNHGGGNTVTTYYTFTKGPAADHQTPATDANFSTISLDKLMLRHLFLFVRIDLLIVISFVPSAFLYQVLRLLKDPACDRQAF